jgi:hypothetical protein
MFLLTRGVRLRKTVSCRTEVALMDKETDSPPKMRISFVTLSRTNGFGTANLVLES